MVTKVNSEYDTRRCQQCEQMKFIGCSNKRSMKFFLQMMYKIENQMEWFHGNFKVNNEKYM